MTGLLNPKSSGTKKKWATFLLETFFFMTRPHGFWFTDLRV